MGISYCDSTVPESPLQSLPTMLHINSIASIRSYSKAPGVFSSICRYAASLPRLYFHRAGPRDSFPLVTPFVHVGTYPTRKYALYSLFACTIGLYLNPRHQKILGRYGSATFGLLLVAFGQTAHFCAIGNYG